MVADNFALRKVRCAFPTRARTHTSRPRIQTPPLLSALRSAPVLPVVRKTPVLGRPSFGDPSFRPSQLRAAPASAAPALAAPASATPATALTQLRPSQLRPPLSSTHHRLQSRPTILTRCHAGVAAATSAVAATRPAPANRGGPDVPLHRRPPPSHRVPRIDRGG